MLTFFAAFHSVLMMRVLLYVCVKYCESVGTVCQPLVVTTEHNSTLNRIMACECNWFALYII